MYFKILFAFEINIPGKFPGNLFQLIPMLLCKLTSKILLLGTQAGVFQKCLNVLIIINIRNIPVLKQKFCVN